MRFVILVCLLLAAPLGAQEMSLRVISERPWVEPTRLGQALNFDFEITNRGRSELELIAIRAFVRDTGDRVVQRLEVNDNGIAPGLQIVPVRTWKPGEAHTIYNPFHTLAADIPAADLQYEFVFKDSAGQSSTERMVVRPRAYTTKTRPILPLIGQVLVWDGHDYTSHHRRWDFSHPVSKRRGVDTNPSRYGFDLVLADDQGRFFSGDGGRREDYPSFGAVVVAPASGTIVAANGDAPNEPSPMSVAGYKKDPLLSVFGNYVVIDHGNGEYSQLGHLKQGSVLVKAGDRVSLGQAIAQVGASGTSLFPHLHYQLVDRPGLEGEGLAVRFRNIRRTADAAEAALAEEWIDTGDIVVSRDGSE